MTELLHQFRDFVDKENLFRVSDRLLVALSGGLDSSVLIHLCLASGHHVEIAHCNFKLRGEESNRDEAFVKSIASEYGVPLHTRHFDTEKYAEHHRLSVQEAARELRYNWFHDLAASRGINHILTAHHADDNAETVMMNIFKGTGMAGLRGIQPKSGKLIRPLLFADRDRILAYARRHGIAFVEDSSNLSDKYTRNFFRLNIIPFLEQVYPGVMGNLKNNLPRFREAEWLYREAVERKLSKLVSEKGREWHIPVEKLRAAQPRQTILHELFSKFGFVPGQLNEIVKLMDSSTGKFMLSGTHRLLKNRNWFIVTPLETGFPSVITVEEGMEEVRFPGGELLIHTADVNDLKPGQDPGMACMDAREVSFPLVIRQWKPGDYFYPLGMQKKKKLARFFIDQKLSLATKEKIWVIESDKRIIWVIGMRIDDRVKLTPSSKQMVKMVYQPVV